MEAILMRDAGVRSPDLPPHIMNEEAFYSQDLAVKRYAGKWKTAKCRVADHMQLYARKLEFPLGIDYWLAVRTMYLELGGLYTEQT